MSRFVVDTHALLWFVLGDERLGARARTEMSDPTNELILPAIAWAESQWIVANGRVKLDAEQLRQAVEADPRISIVPLTREIVDLAQSLTRIPEMHDRQIAATALFLGTKLDPVILIRGMWQLPRPPLLRFSDKDVSEP